MLSGTWAALSRPSPTSGTGTMMLLPDGSVLVEGGGVANTWSRLAPDSSGSYVNGTWSPMASMSLQRLYFASNVLPDGRVFLVGGEYSGPTGASNFTNTGEIYNPLTNSWSSIPNFPQSRFGDDPSAMLPDGRVLTGYLSGPQTYIYNPSSNSWSAAATKLDGDSSDEETWVKLPDGSILSYDVFSSGKAQRYIPSQNKWVETGAVPVSLTSSSVGYELGPGFLLPDGRVFYLGANGNTAFYTPSTDSWAAGPVIPNGLGADDAPGAELPNGKILFAADPPNNNDNFHGPTTLFEFDPTTNTYTNVTPSGYSLTAPAFGTRMLVLPTGQVLFTNGSNRLEVYTPDGAPNASWQPTISGISQNADGTFLLTGTQINGISEGASYGDDAEMSSNYPIVRLTDSNGDVSYARTYNWSSTGVATGTTPETTDFAATLGRAAGTYSVSVVASGIASNPFSLTIPSSPWSSQDVGSVGLAGSAVQINGTTSVFGAGSDIGGTADAFRFAYQTLTGDGAIVARVATQQNTNALAQAGVMIRGDTTAGSAMAAMVITPGSGAIFESRTTPGAAATGVTARARRPPTGSSSSARAAP